MAVRCRPGLPPALAPPAIVQAWQRRRQLRRSCPPGGPAVEAAGRKRTAFHQQRRSSYTASCAAKWRIVCLAARRRVSRPGQPYVQPTLHTHERARVQAMLPCGRRQGQRPPTLTLVVLSFRLRAACWPLTSTSSWPTSRSTRTGSGRQGARAGSERQTPFLSAPTPPAPPQPQSQLFRHSNCTGHGVKSSTRQW